MNTTDRSAPRRRPPALRALAAASLAALLLARVDGAPAATAAGVGVGSPVQPQNGVGSGGTGKSYAKGTVQGFGSVVVNGVHYDDTTATVVDDDGVARTMADLHLGSAVTIDAGPIADAAATATRIQISSDLVGPVGGPYDPASSTLQVMGQTVVIDAGTALDGFPGGAAGIPAGLPVEVSSIYDPVTGAYEATRIDPKLSAVLFKTRGMVAGLDTRGRTFRIGSQVFNYALASGSLRLVNGQVVAVETAPARNAAGQWVVSAVLPPGAVPKDGAHVEVQGSALVVANGSRYVVGQFVVDPTRALVLPAGAHVSSGDVLEVVGSLSGGVLVATQVTDASIPDDVGGGHESLGTVTLAGAALAAPDTVHHTVLMRGPTVVDYGGARFLRGSPSQLAGAARIEVQGALSADGTRVIARTVRIVR